MDRNRTIKTASVISLAGNAVLAISKISIGLIAGSLSVLGDGLDSLADIFISLITLVISAVIAHPPDREHPYGHYRAETIATSILSFIIFFIGGQLSLSAAEKLISHDYIQMPGPLAVHVTIASIVGKLILSWSQYRLGKKSGSTMIITNGRNMLNDAVTSAGVLAGLVFVFLFETAIIDRALAIAIGIWIMITAVRIFRGTVTEMMEGESDMDLYNRIFDAVRDTDSLFNPHRVRIRKLGFHYIVDMDVEVAGSMRVKDAHDKVRLLEERIRSSMPNIYDVVIHIEPLGNVEAQERWGLEEKDLR
ncbi:MAG: cation transporter [Spirochaetes bacterium]|nr:cation transporter [Spirochaetota bacterium]